MFPAFAGAPTPSTSRSIDNRLAWGIVAVPLVGMVLEAITGSALPWAYLAANIALCVLDERRLKATGREAPSSWWCLLIPVYLWKRARLLKQSKKIFWCWVAAFALSLMIGGGGQEAAMEQRVATAITEYIQGLPPQQAAKLFGDDNAAGADSQKAAPKCKAVKIDEKVTDSMYNATAYLDTGKTIEISFVKVGDNILIKSLIDE